MKVDQKNKDLPLGCLQGGFGGKDLFARFRVVKLHALHKLPDLVRVDRVLCFHVVHLGLFRGFGLN